MNLRIRRTAGDRCPFPIRGPQQAADWHARHAGDTPQEDFWALYLDSKHEVQGSLLIARGGLNSAVVHPADVIMPALALAPRPAAVILMHNHPSGDPQPSEEDIRLTHRFFDALRLVGLDLLDHIVIGYRLAVNEPGALPAPSFVSLRERGVIEGGGFVTFPGVRERQTQGGPEQPYFEGGGCTFEVAIREPSAAQLALAEGDIVAWSPDFLSHCGADSLRWMIGRLVEAPASRYLAQCMDSLCPASEIVTVLFLAPAGFAPWALAVHRSQIIRAENPAGGSAAGERRGEYGDPGDLGDPADDARCPECGGESAPCGTAAARAAARGREHLRRCTACAARFTFTPEPPPYGADSGEPAPAGPLCPPGEDPDEWAERVQMFEDPGSNSALRRATRRNPRNLPCPTCGAPNRLTPADRAAGYQCNACADRDERGW